MIQEPGFSSMRPVVSYVSSPTYKQVKYLDIWFKQITNFQPHLVRDSIELADQLAPTPPHPSWKYSCFVWCGNLYPNVPIKLTRKRLEELPKKAQVPDHLLTDFKILLKKCLKPNNPFTLSLLASVSPLDHLWVSLLKRSSCLAWRVKSSS